jgi:hypothetical protein
MKHLSKAISVLQTAAKTASPVPAMYIASLAVGLQADLPGEYTILLERCGLFSIPGEPLVELYDPATILAYCVSIYNLQGMTPAEWPCVPIASLGRHGDDIGFLRQGDRFASRVLMLDHEILWKPALDTWYKPLAESLTALVVQRFAIQ